MSNRHILSLALVTVLALGAVPAWGNSLAVTNAAALVGNFGLALTIDANQTQPAFVAQDDPGIINAETHVLARWQIGNLLALGSGMQNSRSWIMFQLQGDNAEGLNKAIGRFYVIRKNGRFRIRCHCKRNNGEARFCSALSLPAGADTATVEYEWTQNNGDGSTEGCVARAQGIGEVSRSDVNSSITTIRGMRLGLVASLNLTPSAGTFFIDEFESFR